MQRDPFSLPDPTLRAMSAARGHRRPKPKREVRVTPQSRLIAERFGVSDEWAEIFAARWAMAGWFDAPALEAWFDIGADVADVEAVEKLVNLGVTASLAARHFVFKGKRMSLLDHVRQRRITTPQLREELIRRRLIDA